MLGVASFPVGRSVALFPIVAVDKLLMGETGTDKELIAKAIHAKIGRRDRTLVKVSCADLPPTQIERFGHETHAFTRAVSRKNGRR